MTTTPPEAPPAKPAWTRCDQCKQRLWNDRIDIEVHRAVCPADLKRTIRNLGRALDDAVKRIELLEQRPVAHIVELEAGPSLDFEHEAPWPADAPQEPVLDDEPDIEPLAPSPTVPATRARSPWGDDDEDDDYDGRPIR